jgi:hypothetical protein
MAHQCCGQKHHYLDKNFSCIDPHVLVPAPVLAKRLFSLWKEHNCLDGAGISGGFYKNTLRFSIRTHQYRYRYLLKGSFFFVVVGTVWFVRCKTTHVSIRMCRNRYRYPLKVPFPLWQDHD